MPLTTLAAVKKYLKMQPSDTTDDELLDTLISATSLAIENYCERKFVEKTYIDEEYNGTGHSGLYLLQYPVKNITKVIENDVELSPSAYKVNKNNGKLIKKHTKWSYGEVNILVSYTAGFAEIPEDLELACKVFVKSFFNTDVANFSTTFGEGFVFRADSIPAQVKMLLQPYKKVM